MAVHIMRIREELLTVDLAHELLAANTSNRPLKQDAIRRYRFDMLNGLWRETGEPLKIDVNGVLLDGQNRCHALIQANESSEDGPIAVPILIVEGLEPDAQDVMDSGKMRSVPDQLARRGITNTTRTSAALRLIVAYERKTMRLNTMTTAAMLNFYDENREALDAAVDIIPLDNNTSGVTKPTLVAATYLISKVCDDQAAIEDFMGQVAIGINLAEGSPALALRTRMQYARLYRESFPNILALHTVLRAWNAHRTGQTLAKLPVRHKGKRQFTERIEP